MEDIAPLLTFLPMPCPEVVTWAWPPRRFGHASQRLPTKPGRQLGLMSADTRREGKSSPDCESQRRLIHRPDRRLDDERSNRAYARFAGLHFCRERLSPRQ